MKLKNILLALVFPQIAFSQTNIEKVILNQNENYVNVVSKSTSGLTLEISIGNFSKTPVSIDGNSFYSISLENESSILEKGNPELPKIVRSIAIPATSDFKANIMKSEFIDIDSPIIPSKGILSRIVNPDDIAYNFSSIYSSNEFFPKKRLSFGDPYLIRSVRGSAISIFPFAYNPISKKLRVYTKLIIEISFVGTNLENSISRVSDEKNNYFEPIFKNHFLNYDNQNNYKSASAVSENGRMLIIAYDSFIDEMQPFVDHKNCIGLPTQMVKTSTVGSTFDNVYNYIKNNYNSDHNLTFVLLVGDDTQIPTKMVNSGGSDPSYSLMDGDNYPDIIVGRFSAETEAQVITMVNRSITYEKMVDQPWFHNGIGIGSAEKLSNNNEYDYQHLRIIRNQLLNGLYSAVSELYDGSQGGLDASGNPTGSMVSNVINNGASVINFTGHGSENSWGTSGFSISNINSLTNDNKLPFIFSVACKNGFFTNHFCFAESWLRAINTNTGNPIGAIAFYGSSYNVAAQPAAESQDQFNTLLVSNTYSSFGALCYNACINMMSIYGAGAVSEGTKTFLNLNIFGDPSINIKRPSMTGPNIVCSSSATFTVNNVPNGSTINWTCSSNLSFDHLSGNPKSFSANSSGTGWVQATINLSINTCGQVILPQQNVWAGTPLKPTKILFFPSEPCLNQSVIATVTATNPAISGVHYEWTGGGHDYIDQNSTGTEVHFTTLPLYPYTTYVYVNGTNTCGSSADYSKFLTVKDCGGGLPPAPAIVFPNPASTDIEISLGAQSLSKDISANIGTDSYEISIVNTYGMPIYTGKMKDRSVKINVSGWLKGLYIIKIYTKDEVIDGKFLIE